MGEDRAVPSAAKAASLAAFHKLTYALADLKREEQVDDLCKKLAGVLQDAAGAGAGRPLPLIRPTPAAAGAGGGAGTPSEPQTLAELLAAGRSVGGSDPLRKQVAALADATEAASKAAPGGGPDFQTLRGACCGWSTSSARSTPAPPSRRTSRTASTPA